MTQNLAKHRALEFGQKSIQVSGDVTVSASPATNIGNGDSLLESAGPRGFFADQFEVILKASKFRWGVLIPGALEPQQL